jgi:hypothetical protein
MMAFAEIDQTRGTFSMKGIYETESTDLEALSFSFCTHESFLCGARIKMLANNNQKEYPVA